MVALFGAGTNACPYKFFVIFASLRLNVWIPVLRDATRKAKPRQLYFFSTSRAITMRMTSDAPSVIIRLR